MGIISDELTEVRELFAVPRRTEIVDWSGDMEDEDLIEREDMVVTVTQSGYIKRTPLADFRSQRRGGKGVSGGGLKDDDVVTTLFVANTHTQLLFFTTDGMVYKLKTWRLPQGGRTSKGKAIVNILPIPTGVSIAAIMPVDRDESDWDDLQIVFATSAGDVRRNALSDFTNVMRNGKIAMELERGRGASINARIASEDDDVMLVTDSGRAIRFPATRCARLQRRASPPACAASGCRTATSVVSMSIIRHFEATPDERAAYLKMRRADGRRRPRRPRPTRTRATPTPQLPQERYAEMSAAENLILTITANGAGKLSSSAMTIPCAGAAAWASWRWTRRCAAARWSPPSRSRWTTRSCSPPRSGQSIRVPVEGISFRSRSAGGVKVFNTGQGEEVVSVAWIAEQADEAEVDDGEGGD